VELVFLDHYAAFENLETYHEDPMNEM
jgi:hypothetical protein